MNLFLKTFLLIVLFQQFVVTDHIAYAQAPQPTPTLTIANQFLLGLKDCQNIPKSGSVAANKFIEHCRSLRDSQAGFPYHTCKVLKDPISSNIESAFTGTKAAVNSMLPTWLAGMGVIDILFGTGNSVAAGLNSTFNTLATVFFISPNASIVDPNDPYRYLVRTSYDMQYFAGCNTGAICAQALDLSRHNIIGDNVCIPQSELEEYITAKKQAVNGKPEDLKIILERIYANKESIYKSKPLSSLCLRNTANGDNIISYLLESSQPHAAGVKPNSAATRFGFSNDAIMDAFYTNKDNAKLIRDNADDIISKLGTYRASHTGLPLVTWKGYMGPKAPAVIKKQELESFAQCLEAAHEGKLYTAIGNIDIENLATFISTTVFGILMGFAGAFTLGCAIYSAVSIQMSQGGEGYTKARETLMHCLSGLALIIFATFMLRFIGVDILRIPGMG